MSEPYLGEIKLVPYNFTPRGWVECAGQLLNIAEHQALFALLGGTYGGDERVTFGVPDLRGRVAVGQGRGPGLSIVQTGMRYGVEGIRLEQAHMPNHTHDATFEGTGGSANADSDPIKATVTVNAHQGNGDADGAEGNYWATTSYKNGPASVASESGYSSTSDVKMASKAVEVAISGGGGGGGGITGGTVTNTAVGGSQPFTNSQPSLVLRYIMAVEGTFPSRN